MINPDVFAPDDYVSPENAGYAWSLFIGVGLLGIVCGGLIVWMLLKARALSKAHARDEKEMLDLAARPLSAGPHRVVFGRVDLDEEDDVALEIDIDQTVNDHSSKNGRWHTWDEVDRELKKKPFYLVRDDGETIYVEPPEDVLVVDDLDTKYPIDAPRTRVRFADVRRGEQFFVYGDLDRGAHPRGQSAYRDGSGWILRSPRQRMLLATAAISGRYRERIHYLNLVGGVSAVIFVILHAFITMPFLEAAFFGTRTTGTVVDRKTWVTTNKGNKTNHYSLTVKTPDNLVFDQEVSHVLYEAMIAERVGDDPASIPVLETAHSERASYFGFEPNLLVFWLLFGTIVWLTTVIIVALEYRNRLPWYDRPKLNEHGGSGYWVEPRPQNPVV